MGASNVFFFVPGVSQTRPWTRLGVNLARHRAPRAKQMVLGSILGAILAPKMRCFRLRSICGVYRVFCMSSLLLFSFISAFFGRARKRPKGQIRHTLRAKTCFFKVRACAGFAARTTTDGQKKTPKENGKKTNNHQKHEISGSRRRPPKKAPKMTSRRLPGTLREPPGRARRGPRGAKRAPRRPQEPPRAPPRAAQRRS